jgi:predicted nucleotidyltransferase
MVYCEVTTVNGLGIRAMTIHQKQLDRAIALAKAYGATRLILFGSAAIALDRARDLDLACDGVAGWKFYELGARLEEELRIPLDLVPLSPSTRFTRLIERQGKVLL